MASVTACAGAWVSGIISLTLKTYNNKHAGLKSITNYKGNIMIGSLGGGSMKFASEISGVSGLWFPTC